MKKQQHYIEYNITRMQNMRDVLDVDYKSNKLKDYEIKCKVIKQK